MEDSIFDASIQIPSTAAPEVGPVAIGIAGDSLSMDNRAQELEEKK